MAILGIALVSEPLTDTVAAYAHAQGLTSKPRLIPLIAVVLVLVGAQVAYKTGAF
jgi:hypothetical protein